MKCDMEGTPYVQGHPVDGFFEVIDGGNGEVICSAHDYKWATRIANLLANWKRDNDSYERLYQIDKAKREHEEGIKG